MENNKLTDKQLRFVEEYMVDFNATQASIRAGYSKKTAASIGDENLRKPAIAKEIEKRKAELSKTAKKTRDNIIEDLTKVVDQFLLDGRNTVHALKAIEILNKMLGFNEPEKSDIKVTGLDIKKLLDFED